MLERKDIEKRIGELQAQEQQHLAHANACMGAIGELSRLLAVWDAPAASPAPQARPVEVPPGARRG